jgi:hypothetical protein
MLDLNSAMRREIKRFGGETVRLAKVAADMPGIMPTSADLQANVAAAQLTGGATVLTFDLRGSTFGAGAGAEVRSVLTSASVLRPIVQAARARGA